MITHPCQYIYHNICREFKYHRHNYRNDTKLRTWKHKKRDLIIFTSISIPSYYSTLLYLKCVLSLELELLRRASVSHSVSSTNQNITKISEGGDAAPWLFILSHLQIWNKPLSEKDSQKVLTAGGCAGIPAPPSTWALKQAQRRHSTTFNYLKTKVI